MSVQNKTGGTNETNGTNGTNGKAESAQPKKTYASIYATAWLRGKDIQARILYASPNGTYAMESGEPAELTELGYGNESEHRIYCNIVRNPNWKKQTEFQISVRLPRPDALEQERIFRNINAFIEETYAEEFAWFCCVLSDIIREHDINKINALKKVLTAQDFDPYAFPDQLERISYMGCHRY
jgi:hypothetical protein